MSQCAQTIRLYQGFQVSLGQTQTVRLGQGFALHVCAPTRESNPIPEGVLMLSEGVPILSEDGRFIVVANWVPPDAGPGGDAMLDFSDGDNSFYIPVV